ncbi:MAG: GNAT family N-acetyltransferase [Lachnospiraceae bacterium]|nr:GNAT family N-acetyltransferase [Lachnospiraceae bacterium]
MSYRIRRAKDLSMIVTLNTIIFPEDALHLDEQTVAWVAYDKNNQPAAFCTARKLEDRVLYFDRGGVLKEHQGKGLHRKLIEIRERYARKNKYKTAITYVMKDNIKSLCTLVRCDYLIYTPVYQWAGKAGDMIYYLIKEFK